MAARKRYVVAIGEYDPTSGRLVQEGKKAAKKAGKHLGSFITPESVVLALDTPRHRKTAKIIAKRIGSSAPHLREGLEQELWPDPRLNIEDVPRMFEQHLEGTSIDGVPAILPLSPEVIASLLDTKTEDISGGTIYEYNPKSGLTPLE